MDKTVKEIFKILIRILITPILIGVTILVLLIYCIIGLIIIPAQTIRYVGLTTLAAVQSAFDNNDYTNVFLDALYEFYKKYFAFFGQIFYITLAIWIPANENPSQLTDIIKYEWKILTNNWLWTILTYLALVLSFAFSFSFLGLKGLDYFKLEKLKDKLYKGWTTKETSEYKQVKIDSLGYNSKDSLTVVAKYYKNKIDSLNKIISSYPKPNPSDFKKISELEKEISTLKSKSQKIRTEYVDKIVYKNKPEPFHPYGKGKGKLVVYITCSDCYNFSVSVDGIHKGTLTKYFTTGSPNCYQNDGTISLIVNQGSHLIEGRDQSGVYWNNWVEVKEDECFTQRFG